jgi:adhesin transport system outer membrane protein
MKTFFGGIGLCAAGVFLLLAGGTAHSETIQDAIQATIKSNPDVRATAYNKLAREQEVVQARSRYFPTLDVRGSTGYYDQEHPNDYKNWPKEAVVSLRQNVFEGGASLSEVQRQQARVKSQAFLVQAVSENVGLQACRAYLNVLREMDLYNLARENLRIHERIYDQVRSRSEAGVDRKADLDQVSGRLALAQANLVTARANLEDARSDYQAVVGHLPGDNLAAPMSVDAAIPATKEDAEYLAVQNYPTLKSAKADVEAREKQHETAKRVLSPSFDVAADYRWQDGIDGLVDTSPAGNYKDRYREDLSVTASVRFNIFNGFQNMGRIKETRHLVSEGEEIMKSTERQVVHSMRLSYESYLTAQERMKKLSSYARSAAMTAEAFAVQWNIGRRTLFDILDTQAEYINAKADLVNATYDQKYASYRVLAGMGKLAETFGVAHPEEGKAENIKKF